MTTICLDTSKIIAIVSATMVVALLAVYIRRWRVYVISRRKRRLDDLEAESRFLTRFIGEIDAYVAQNDDGVIGGDEEDHGNLRALFVIDPPAMGGRRSAFTPVRDVAVARREMYEGERRRLAYRLEKINFWISNMSSSARRYASSNSMDGTSASDDDYDRGIPMATPVSPLIAIPMATP